MNRINLHAHSHFSDGQDTLETMAQEARRLGFTALVVTDHIYLTNTDYSLNVQKLARRAEVGALVAEKVGIPVILGIEIPVAGEEICVFGTEVIKDLVALRDQIVAEGIGSYRDIGGLLSSRWLQSCSQAGTFAAFLNHPGNLRTFIDGGWWKIISGYEKFNQGHDWFNGREVPSEMVGLKALSNSDAHRAKDLDLGWNVPTTPITTEQELINFLNGPEQPKLYAADRLMRVTDSGIILLSR